MIIVKIPFSAGSLGKNEGCEKAPDEILKEIEADIDSVKVDKFNFDETFKNIYEKIKIIKDKFFILGGDHSITYSSFKAFSEGYKNSGLVVFDAHPDCEISTKTISHEDYLRNLIDDGLLKKENVILIGVRKFSKTEINYVKEKGIKYFTPKTLNYGLDDFCDMLMEDIRRFDGVYLSIDIDVVDPGFAPGTGYLEPGGISSRELLFILERIKVLKNIQAIDLVEINPEKDVNNMTVLLGQKILSEFL